MAFVDTEEQLPLATMDLCPSWQGRSSSATRIKAASLLKAAKACFATDTTQSLLLSRQAITLLESLPLVTDEKEAVIRVLLQARCFNSLAACLERQSHFEAAIAEIEKALALLEPLRREDRPISAGFISAYSDALHTLGNCHQSRGRYFEALQYFQTQLRFLEPLGARREQVGVRNAIASIYFYIGDYVTAMEASLQGLALAEEVSHRFGQGSALNLLGNLYLKRGDKTTALASYTRSLAVFKKIGDRYWQAGILGNQANVYLEMGERDKALEMHYASLRLREAVQDRQGQAHSLLNLGNLYAGKQENGTDIPMSPEDKELSRALHYYKKALKLFKQIEDGMGMAFCLVRIGDLYLVAGRLSRAIVYGAAALAAGEEMGLREHIYQAHRLLSDVYERLGDFSNALKHHKQFHAVKEAVFNAENEERVRNLEVLHRVSQVKQDVDSQKRLSERLAVTVKALRNADSEKALLLIKLRQQAGLLEMQLRIDALTGLLNRWTLDQRLEEEWEYARRENHPLCLVLCDIDHFKQINDRFSHSVGDAVLRRVSLLFQQSLRKQDIAARYGGEEFVFLLRATSLAEATRLCEDIRDRVSHDNWESIHPDLRVTISIGICEASGALREGEAEKALRYADDALYEAKRQGRNRVCHALFAVP
jgi:diguanylate cyclase (GGDEF)-like protein